MISKISVTNVSLNELIQRTQQQMNVQLGEQSI